MTHSRRRFLRNVLLAGGGLAGFGGMMPGIVRLARAAGEHASEAHYVFVYFSGGWDTLLGLDPRDPDDFPEEFIAEHRIQPGYDKLQNAPNGGALRTAGGVTFGPYIGNILTQHVDRLAVVRGMSMDTLTHEVGRRRFLTGKPPAGLQARGSSAATWLAARLGMDDAIPHLSVGVETYNVDQPTYASALRVTSSTDLVTLLSPATPSLDPMQDQILTQFLASEAGCERSRHSPGLRSADAARLRMRDMLSRELDDLFDFRSSSLAPLVSEFAVPANDFSGPEAQALVAYQALTHGVARCVSMLGATSLDTHFNEWARDHGPRQMRGFDAVGRLIGKLRTTPYVASDGTTQGTWLDHTTIVGFSEFMRTPLLNDRGGRDHWLCNSCFLAGGSIQPGVIGASSDVGMQPQPVSLASGAVDEAHGEVIRPEHVLRTLMVDGGIADDEADLRVEPIAALLG
ncbi:MAG: DUF1501 domain-containing protein [Sandaracinus sp.]